MNELAIFDVDGTLVKGQSQLLFLKYLLSKKRINMLFYSRLVFWFILYKIGIVKNPIKPMEYAFSFIKGRTVAGISLWAHDFFLTELRNHIYMDAVDVVRDHQSSGREVILVSNSVEFIVKEVADFLKVDRYIATTLEKKDGLYTGKVASIVYGDLKTEAVKKFVEENGLDIRTAWAYGDHDSDRFLLAAVKHPFAINASRSLSRIAEQNHWPTLAFKELMK